MKSNTWHIKCYIWDLTCNTWHMTHDIWHKTFFLIFFSLDFIVILLLSAHFERLSVSRKCNFSQCFVNIFITKKIKFEEKNATSPILTPAETKLSVLLSALVERFGVSCMRDFYIRHGTLFSKIYHKNIFNTLQLRPTGDSRTVVSRHLRHLWIVFCPKWAVTITEKRI